MSFINNACLLSQFCDAHETLGAGDIILATAYELGLQIDAQSIKGITQSIIRHIETTPTHDDQIAMAKLRLRLMVEEAYMALFPQSRSSQGPKFST